MYFNQKKTWYSWQWLFFYYMNNLWGIYDTKFGTIFWRDLFLNWSMHVTSSLNGMFDPTLHSWMNIKNTQFRNISFFRKLFPPSLYLMTYNCCLSRYHILHEELILFGFFLNKGNTSFSLHKWEKKHLFLSSVEWNWWSLR